MGRTHLGVRVSRRVGQYAGARHRIIVCRFNSSARAHRGGECKTAAAADEDEPAIRKETRKQAARSFSFDRLGATRASSPRSSSFCMEEVELKNEQRSKGKEPNEQSNRDSNRKRGQATALALLLSLIVVFNLLVGARLLPLLFFFFFFFGFKE